MRIEVRGREQQKGLGMAKLRFTPGSIEQQWMQRMMNLKMCQEEMHLTLGHQTLVALKA